MTWRVSTLDERPDLEGAVRSMSSDVLPGGVERDDGLSFDPWLRVHRRPGAEFLRVAPRSMRITGTVGEWEGWTGMRFQESGPYVVPGALCPVQVDLERDLGASGPAASSTSTRTPGTPSSVSASGTRIIGEKVTGARP